MSHFTNLFIISEGKRKLLLQKLSKSYLVLVGQGTGRGHKGSLSLRLPNNSRSSFFLLLPSFCDIQQWGESKFICKLRGVNLHSSLRIHPSSAFTVLGQSRPLHSDRIEVYQKAFKMVTWERSEVNKETKAAAQIFR